VITIDSLRPDHLGCYGYARPTSPNLDAFAARAVRFTNAFSTSSFTPPSHGSLLTSRHVGDHGLLTWNALRRRWPRCWSRRARTGASVNLTLLSDNCLGRGVEWQREGAREARTIVSEALEFVRAAGALLASSGSTDSVLHVVVPAGPVRNTRVAGWPQPSTWGTPTSSRPFCSTRASLDSDPLQDHRFLRCAGGRPYSTSKVRVAFSRALTSISWSWPGSSFEGPP